MGQLKTNRSAENGRAQGGMHAPFADVELASHCPSTATACPSGMPGEMGTPSMQHGDDEAPYAEDVARRFIFGRRFQEKKDNHAVRAAPQSSKEDSCAVMLARDMREMQESVEGLDVGLANGMGSSVIKERVTTLAVAAVLAKCIDSSQSQRDFARSRGAGQLVAPSSIDAGMEVAW